VIAGAAAPSQAREWYKNSRTLMGSQGQPVVRWTTISTVDDVQPWLQRVLYMDQGGHRLVIRHTLDETTGQNVDSIQYVPTGEIVTFEIHDQSTMVVTGGAQQMTISRAEVEAYNPEGPTFPPAVLAQASVLFSGLSAEFRTALGTLARTGCENLIEFYSTGMRYAYLFFDDVPCRTPPAGFVHPVDGALDLDPAATPPGPFEQPFGAAYFE